MQHVITRIVDALSATAFQDEINAYLEANPDHRLMRLDAVPLGWEGGTRKDLDTMSMANLPAAERKVMRLVPPAVFAVAVFENQEMARKAVMEMLARQKQDAGAWQAHPNRPAQPTVSNPGEYSP